MNEAIKIFDVVIIGAGPAGMSASIYTSRAGLTTLIVEKEAPGGKMIKTDIIENYPGFDSITGYELSMKMYNQTSNLGTKFEFSAVEDVKKHDNFELSLTNGKTIIAKAVILATGTQENKLQVLGEDKLYGKGVSYCSVCDGALYKGKDVLVVGGGYSAITAANFLSNLVNKVYVAIRKDSFRADLKNIAILESKSNVEILKQTIVEEIVGNEKVEMVRLKKKDDSKIDLQVSAIFPYIGSKPVTQFVKKINITTSDDYIDVNDKMETIIPGLYAIGDVRDVPLRQIAIAVGDGAIAGQMVVEYLQNIVK